MNAKKKKSESSFHPTNIIKFFEGLVFKNSAENVSSVDETSNGSINRELVVQKEALVLWPPAGDESRSKGNDVSEASLKDSQDKNNTDLTRPVERKIDTQECIIGTVKTEEEQQSERNSIKDKSKSVEQPRSEQCSVQSDSPIPCKLKTEGERQSARSLIQNRSRETRSKSVGRTTNEQHSVQSDSTKPCKLKIEEELQSARHLIQNRNRQDRSKSVERPRNEQHFVQPDLPKPCKFKTEDGRWLCQVCSWSSSDVTPNSFLGHCSSRNHREKIKGRFDPEQELGELSSKNSSKVKNKTDADSQVVIWSEVKKNGNISVVKTKKQQTNLEQQNEKSKNKKPTTEMMCKSQQTQSRVANIEQQKEKSNNKKPTTEMLCKSQQTQDRVCQEHSKQEASTLKMKELLKERLSVEELFKALAETLTVPESNTQNDKKQNNKMKPEAGSFKEKLLEIVKQEEKAEIRKGLRKKANKKKDSDTKKVETDSEVNIDNTKNLCQGGGEGSSQSEDLRIAEMKKWISVLGITFIKPVSANFLNCNLCEKLVPAGSDFETLVINVGIHVEGKPHVKKVALIKEASVAIVNLMKSIQKSPTRSLLKNF